MAGNGQSKEVMNAVLYQIVLDKLKANKRLSRDEHWYYLTGILQVSRQEAERMMEKYRTEPGTEAPDSTDMA